MSQPGMLALMRRRVRLAYAFMAVVLAIAAATSPFGAAVTRAADVLPLRIVVDTTADTEAADGYCSLREAIKASNGGGWWYECQGSAATDGITFNVGTGVINVASSLPAITAPVTINGGATPDHIRGPGYGTGLTLQGADGSSVRGMIIDNFGTGISVSYSDTTIVGNVIGPNTGTGIYVEGASVTIGGTNVPTVTAPCAADCNVISGNGGYGIYSVGGGGWIRGNFIGINAAGSAASPNGTGIQTSTGYFTIGGTSAGERNVISGNTGDGLFLNGCNCTIQGNFIGTNAAGNGKVPNGDSGIYVQNSSLVIGGNQPGMGNLISGNTGAGVDVMRIDNSYNLTIQGNKIGMKAAGGALANGGAGILLHTSPTSTGEVREVGVGSPTDPAAANEIAYNTGAGVSIDGAGARYNSVRGNSIHHNGGAGIDLVNSANQSIMPPVITGISPISGTACASCAVDIYSDSADEGMAYHGSVTADVSGNWTYPAAVSGPNVTATSTNTNGSTSEFSAPFALPVPKKPDGRIRKGTGALVGNNVYNLTGQNQTKSGSTTRGNTITFGLSIQNDSNADSFKVLATGSTTSQYSVSYFRNSTNITAAVVAGTYTTPMLANGGTFLITAKVKVNSSATVGSSVTRLVTISSVADPTKKDAVKFIGKRS